MIRAIYTYIPYPRSADPFGPEHKVESLTTEALLDQEGEISIGFGTLQ